MKSIGIAVMLAALAGTGCVTLPTKGDDPAQRPAPPPPPPPVTPEGITEANAAERARALRAELERERPAAEEGEPGEE